MTARDASPGARLAIVIAIATALLAAGAGVVAYRWMERRRQATGEEWRRRWDADTRALDDDLRRAAGRLEAVAPDGAAASP